MASLEASGRMLPLSGAGAVRESSRPPAQAIPRRPSAERATGAGAGAAEAGAARGAAREARDLGHRGSLPSEGPGGRSGLGGGGGGGGKAGGAAQAGGAATEEKPAAQGGKKEKEHLEADGWTAHKDPDTGLTYFYNARTGLSEWEGAGAGGAEAEVFEDARDAAETPTGAAGGAGDAARPPSERDPLGALSAEGGAGSVGPPGDGWSLHLDPDSGCKYWYHAARGESVWQTEE